jgi:hypothetical protein
LSFPFFLLPYLLSSPSLIPAPPLFTIATIPAGQPHRSLTLMPSPPLHSDRYAFACMCHPPCHTPCAQLTSSMTNATLWRPLPRNCATPRRAARSSSTGLLTQHITALSAHQTEGDVVQVGRVNFFILGDGINPDTEGMFF